VLVAAAKNGSGSLRPRSAECPGSWHFQKAENGIDISGGRGIWLGHKKGRLKIPTPLKLLSRKPAPTPGADAREDRRSDPRGFYGFGVKAA
jgi:hypothetical protein